MSSDEAPAEDEAAKAAEEAVDPDRLLAGEEPSTTYLEDARTWMAVYDELASFKDDLVASTEARARSMQQRAAGEVLETDLPVLRAEAERLHRRLAFWRRRVAELDGRGGAG